MRISKNKIRLIIAAVLCAGLTACGAVPLSDRGIVRAVFFGRHGSGCTVTLLLQNNEGVADGKSEQYKTAFGEGDSYEQAWHDAEQNSDKTPFYGLMNLAAFPPGVSGEQAAHIGSLIYEKAQPLPEISTFALAEETPKGKHPELYEKMCELEKTYKVHYGLEALFAGRAAALLPLPADEGYQLALLQMGAPAVVIDSPLAAQLTAVLNGHSQKLQAKFMQGAATIKAEAGITYTRAAEGCNIILTLKNLQWQALTPEALPQQQYELAFENEAQQIFASQQSSSDGADIFHLQFYLYTYGFAAESAGKAELSIVFDY